MHDFMIFFWLYSNPKSPLPSVSSASDQDTSMVLRKLTVLELERSLREGLMTVVPDCEVMWQDRASMWMRCRLVLHAQRGEIELVYLRGTVVL